MSKVVAISDQELVMKYASYPEYKNSGIEWIGALPNTWEVVPVKRWFSEPPCYGVLKPDKYDGEDGVPLIRIMDVTADGKISDINALDAISPSLSVEFRRTIIKKGDLIVSVVGTLGRSFICTDSLERMNLSRALARLQVSDLSTTKYLQYVIGSKVFEDYVGVTCTGAAQKVLNLEDVCNWSIPSPPYEHRETISAFLDFETARIDKFIIHQQRLIDLLQEKRQALISRAVIKGLNPNAVMKKSGIEWFGQVPEHWDASQLKYIVKLGTSITYGIVQAGPHIEDGIPYIKTSDMSGTKLPLDGYSKTSPEIDASYSRSKVYSGDLVIAIRATVGKCHIVPDAINGANLTQGTAKISPSKKITSEFLHLLIMSSPVQLYFDANAKGATFREITLEMLRRTPIVIPPLSEQKLICEYINKTVSIYDRLISKCEFKISLLVERRAALISAAVTGKIDLRGWKPPAEEAAA